MKHEYFSVILHSDDYHLFTFLISGIKQLQLTCMPQRSKLTDFTMFKLINIALEPILKFYSESSLMHKEAADTASIAFYMNDLFSSYSDFKFQFAFL